MAGKNYHQDSTPVEKFKFDKEADAAAQAQFQPLFDTEGQRVVMPGAQKARIKAQMESHKKPKNRAY
jgi:hypothetical protein